jgi:hypothetical protein
MPSYPMAKVSEDNSMAEKRGVGEHARPAALQDLRDMAKAGLLEPQTSEMGLTSLVTACQDGADRIGRLVFRRLKPSSVERRPARPFKGSSEGPKSCSDVQFDETRDSPTGREAYGDGAAVVVRERERIKALHASPLGAYWGCPDLLGGLSIPVPPSFSVRAGPRSLRPSSSSKDAFGQKVDGASAPATLARKRRQRRSPLEAQP